MLGLAVFWNVRVYRVGARAVDDAVRMTSVRPRPPHRGPVVEGTFEACLGRMLDKAPDFDRMAGHAAGPDREQAIAVREGKQPFSSLSPAVVADIDTALPWVEGLLACSRTEAHGDEEGVGPFADPAHPRKRVESASANAAARTTALAVRRDVQRGLPDDAALLCSDGMAFSRDCAIEATQFWSADSVVFAKLITPACGAALARASPDTLRRVRAELSVARASLPSLADELDGTRAVYALAVSGPDLSGAQLARLGANARFTAEEGARSWEVGPVERRFILAIWHRTERGLEQMKKATTSPSRAADMDDAAHWFWTPFDAAAWSREWSDMAKVRDVELAVYDLYDAIISVRLREGTPATVRASSDGGVVTLTIPWSGRTLGSGPPTELGVDVPVDAPHPNP